MKVMVLVKATKDSEAGIMPSQTLLAEMGKFNEELVKAGVLLAAEGLRPSAKGKRVQLSNGSSAAQIPCRGILKSRFARYSIWKTSREHRLQDPPADAGFSHNSGLIGH